MKWQKGEIVLVINSDSRRALSKAKVLQRLAKVHNLKTVTCAGSDMDHAIRFELQNSRLKRLIIAGGDGSLALGVRLVMKLKKSVEIAIIPVGTSNYYSRTLGVKSIHSAFKIAVGKKVEPRHVCQANGRIFMIGADIGVTSRMVESVSNENKRRWGKLAYIYGVLKLFITFDPMRVTITANGETNTYATTELIVINQSIEEKTHLQPKVHSREPYFEIVTYGIKHTKLSPIFAALISMVTLGRNQKYLKRIRATEAIISTNRPEIVSIDGDSLEYAPLHVKMLDEPVFIAVQ